jgi:hypothetical protein
MTPALSILSLDLSLTSTGWARFVAGQTTMGTIQTSALGMARLEAIRSRVEALAAGTDLVVLEGYSFASRGRAIVSLGELGGVIRHWLHVQQIPTVEIPPACRAKYATGKGTREGRGPGGGHPAPRLRWPLHDEADASGSSPWPWTTTGSGSLSCPRPIVLSSSASPGLSSHLRRRLRLSVAPQDVDKHPGRLPVGVRTFLTILGRLPAPPHALRPSREEDPRGLPVCRHHRERQAL